MPVNVNFNLASVTAQRNLAVSQTGFQKSIERLSSGLRINRASDDAAGLSISEQFRAQVRGTSQAQRNAQDGISLLQTGEGALNETHDILQRMRELAVQASSDTLSTNDRAAITNEVSSLNTEIDRITNSTKFNGINLLTGNIGGKSVGGLGASLVGAKGINSITANPGAAAAATYTLASTAVAGGTSDVTIADGNGNTETVRVTVPTSGNLDVNFKNLGLAVNVNGSLGSSAITATNGFTVSANNSLTLQIGANNATSERMTISGINNMDSSGTGLNTTTVNVTSSSNAQAALTVIDGAIANVSTARGQFGAYQNRLEHTINNLGVTQENMAASESRIRDADVASEMANMTRAQILQQAAQGMLSQANQGAQGALSLLRG